MSDLGASGFEAMGADISAFVVGGGTTTGTPLAVTSMTPGPGSVEAQDLNALTVTFDRPIDPFSIGFDDFRLTREGDPIGVSATINESLDASDPTGHRIVLTLGGALSAGRYQLVMSGWSFLAGTDGASLGGGGDQDLGSFDVVESGPSLAGAIDLGTPTSTPTVRAGTLDLSADPNATDVFKITLPSGQLWSLRLDISAQSDGGTLDSALTLFDANGNRVAFADQGSVNAPLDPHLVVGVPGGTYYIGVSGSSTGTQPDGAYRLHLAANPIGASTTVTSINPDRANPLSTTPTGLTVRFSAPIDLSALERDKSQESDTSHALYLADDQGRSWPLIATQISPDRLTVSFAFQSELPAGTYRIMTGNSAVLVDLVGRAPVARDQAPGVLGTIAVSGQATLAPSDLGTLWPSVGSTVGTAMTLAPGETQIRTFTLIDLGYPSLAINGDAGKLRVTIVNGDGVVVAGVMESATAAPSSGSTSRNFTLPAGTYSLILTNTDAEALPFSVTLTSGTSSSAVLLDSGIGQSSASGSQLVSPSLPTADSPSLPTADSPSGRTEGPIAINPTSPAGPRASLDVTTNSAPSTSSPARSGPVGVPGNSSASVTLVGGIPAGRPSTSFGTIGVVGPASGTGTLALASNQPGLSSGLMVINRSGPSGPRRPAGHSRVGGDATEPARVGVEAPPETGSFPNDTDALDARALADAGWLDRTIAWATDRFRGEEAPAPDAEVPPVGPEGLAVSPGDSTPPGPENELRIEFASLTSPAILIVSVVMAYWRRAGRRRQDRRYGWIAPGPQARASTGDPGHRLGPKCRAGLRP